MTVNPLRFNNQSTRKQRTTARQYLLLSFFSAGLALTGCSSQTEEKRVDSQPEKQKEKTSSLQSADFQKAYDGISIPKLKQHIKYLASDELAGREPGTPGDKMTADYLINEFKSLGVKPGNGESYLQKVEMLAIDSKVGKNLTIDDIEFKFGENFVANTRKKEAVRKLENSELVFVGYGINAPEYGWNDYQGVDAKGKTVVILVNDPGYATANPELFEGNALTYYGRWTYKYEEPG